MLTPEESLQRLHLTSVEMLLLHDPDDFYREALDVAFPTLVDLRRQGVVKAIGAGMNQWRMLADFARFADPDCLLLAEQYTLPEQEALAEFLLAETHSFSYTCTNGNAHSQIFRNIAYTNKIE